MISFHLRWCLAPSLVLVLALSAVHGETPSLNNGAIDGYRGIWFELNQKYPFGDKYSGGLGTYTAKHCPIAIYRPEVEKTFFVYGGTRAPEERHLLCMIGVYDHRSGSVSRPTVVFDKQGVDDPHDDPSLLIDPEGRLYVFVSGRGTRRPGYKFRSAAPYDINTFEQLTQEEMTYPQPWWVDGRGMLHLFTKYSGVRELYFETSSDGETWSEDQKLAGIRERGYQRAGHYQVSAARGNKVVTFMNRHPNGVVDRRTDLYYVQTVDFGRTWTTVSGHPLQIPLTRVDNPARVIDYAGQNRNVYLKDCTFDDQGHPICLYLTSGGHEPGPMNNPRELRVTYWHNHTWHTKIVCETDHNYDMGSLFVLADRWLVVAPTAVGPQHYGTGGEVIIWESTDRGERWTLRKQVTVNSPRNHAYVRRVLNGHTPFHFLWADGDAETFSASHLYFGSLDGIAWVLPYEMAGQQALPKRLTNNPLNSMVP